MSADLFAASPSDRDYGCAEWEMPCPAAGGIPCGSADCLRYGCEDERERLTPRGERLAPAPERAERRAGPGLSGRRAAVPGQGPEPVPARIPRDIFDAIADRHPFGLITPSQLDEWVIAACLERLSRTPEWTLDDIANAGSRETANS